MCRSNNTGEPLKEYDQSQEISAATAQKEEGRSSVIGLTTAGERVHAKGDAFGASAVVQWSSPIECVRFEFIMFYLCTCSLGSETR